MSGKFVYFLKPVGMDGPIKIGCSDYPAYRLKTLMAWSPFELELLATVDGGRDLERNLHEVYSNLHIRGEWFDPSIAMREAIAKIVAGVPVAEAIDLSQRQGGILKGKAKRISEKARERMSYGLRISGRLRGFNKRLGTHLVMPDDIEAIMDAWRGHWKDRDGTGIRPTDAEFAQLDAFINGLPDTAVVSRWWRGKVAA